MHENGAATEKGLKLSVRVHRRPCATPSAGTLRSAADHFGQLTVNDSIRYARAFEPYQLAWAEDFIRLARLARLSRRSRTPPPRRSSPARDIFGLEEGFIDLIDNRAVDIIHPDPETSGALLETKRIADYAADARHPDRAPLRRFAGRLHGRVHLAATLKNFVAMENHAVDMPWWGDLVTGPPKPIIENGYITRARQPGTGRGAE